MSHGNTLGKKYSNAEEQTRPAGKVFNRQGLLEKYLKAHRRPTLAASDPTKRTAMSKRRSKIHAERLVLANGGDGHINEN